MCINSYALFALDFGMYISKGFETGGERIFTSTTGAHVSANEGEMVRFGIFTNIFKDVSLRTGMHVMTATFHHSNTSIDLMIGVEFLDNFRFIGGMIFEINQSIYTTDGYSGAVPSYENSIASIVMLECFIIPFKRHSDRKLYLGVSYSSSELIEVGNGTVFDGSSYGFYFGFEGNIN